MLATPQGGGTSLSLFAWGLSVALWRLGHVEVRYGPPFAAQAHAHEHEGGVKHTHTHPPW